MQNFTRFVASALALLAFTWAGDAFACSCRFVSAQENLATASAVFWGTVTDVTEGEKRVATFAVGKWFKGAEQKSVKVSTNIAGSACGASFDEGDAYLVFAYERDGAYSTSSCTNTTRMRVQPTSAIAKPPPRNLSQQQKALDPVLTALAAKATGTCRGQASFNLTIYDNGEYDVAGGSGCWEKQFAATFKVPQLPSGYPFGVHLRIRNGEVSTHYTHVESAPLVRANIAGFLKSRLPFIRRADRLVVYEIGALDDWVSHSEVETICTLSGEEATLRFLRSRPKTDRGAQRYLHSPQTWAYACAVQRHDWVRASQHAADPDNLGTPPVEDTIRRETAQLKVRPELSKLSVSPAQVLSFARTSRGWQDDVILLQLVAEALLAQPKPSAYDRNLAAMAYARASQLYHPPAADLAQKAIELGGESVVSEMESRVQTQWLERAKKRLGAAAGEGKTPPPLPK